MHIEEIREYCLSLDAHVTEELPFGPDTLVFKIAGKIFLLIGLNQSVDVNFNVKCDPLRAVDLRERYDQTVFPGYHMNKKHWNTVFLNKELNDLEIKELIDHSFSLVGQSLAKKKSK